MAIIGKVVSVMVLPSLLQPEVDSFCVCLDTWGVFLDHLIMMKSSDLCGGQSPPTQNHYER